MNALRFMKRITCNSSRGSSTNERNKLFFFFLFKVANPLKVHKQKSDNFSIQLAMITKKRVEILSNT